MKRRRSILLAFFFSLMAPGLGLLYVGQARKAGLVVLSLIALIGLAALTNAYDHFQGLALNTAMVVIVQLYSCFSAASHAVDSGTFQAKAYNHWGVYLVSMIVMTISAQQLREHQAEIFGARTFRIPNDSMNPSLIPYDFILADTDYIDYQPGDVVVFHVPDQPGSIYAKRIAAMGGDRLEVRNGKTVLNGEISGVLTMSSQFQQKQSSLWLEELSVPEGMVYLLGDKRDQSHDSRKFGAIPEYELVGKVTDIWLSFDTSRIGQPVR